MTRRILLSRRVAAFVLTAGLSGPALAEVDWEKPRIEIDAIHKQEPVALPSPLAESISRSNPTTGYRVDLSTIPSMATALADHIINEDRLRYERIALWTGHETLTTVLERLISGLYAFEVREDHFAIVSTAELSAFKAEAWKNQFYPSSYASYTVFLPGESRGSPFRTVRIEGSGKQSYALVYTSDLPYGLSLYSPIEDLHRAGAVVDKWHLVEALNIVRARRGRPPTGMHQGNDGDRR